MKRYEAVLLYSCGMFGRAERKERRKRKESFALLHDVWSTARVSLHARKNLIRDIPIACFPYHPTRGWGEASRGKTSDPST